MSSPLLPIRSHLQNHKPLCVEPVSDQILAIGTSDGILFYNAVSNKIINIIPQRNVSTLLSLPPKSILAIVCCGPYSSSLAPSSLPRSYPLHLHRREGLRLRLEHRGPPPGGHREPVRARLLHRKGPRPQGWRYVLSVSSARL